MCGFAGELVFDGTASTQRTDAMADVLAHRGPDEVGRHHSADGRLAISFRRLCVIDPAGSHQPMVSPDGSRILAFNGEIYNHPALREALAPRPFVTRGDTEVLLAACEAWGAEAPRHLEGMFAFAFYDAAAGELLLARDRVGQKPLWYAALPGRLIFASEAKALLAHPACPRQTDAEALASYLTIGYCPAPGSIWSGVRKVMPSQVLRVTSAGVEADRYWAPARNCRAQAADRPELEATLTEAVRSHLLSDVPLGALLSGGLDSATVVRLMCDVVDKPADVRTFTAGFGDAAYDERPAAREVAERLGTTHTELAVEPSTDGVVDQILAWYDEPFADSSALPTALICRAAREHVTVALTGDGGDEVFGGYDRYRALLLADTMRPWEYLLARMGAGILRPFARGGERSRLRRWLRFTDALTLPPAVQYFQWRALFQPADLERLLTADYRKSVDIEAPMEWFTGLYGEADFADEPAYAQRHDVLTYLPDDLLVKTDIASMAASLELRAPFLDRRVVELGLSLPLAERMDRRTGKKALRSLMRGRLPASILAGRKKGFGVPLADWLRGPLRDEMVSILTDRKLLDLGMLEPAGLAGLMNDHLSGRQDHAHRLWALMVLARFLISHG